jgi:hypothetical protein
MLSFADSRGFETPDERFSSCVFCGRTVVVLPDDRRAGSCFDCLALSVAPPTACPECGSLILGEDRALGCGDCGWYPIRH